MSVLTIRIPDSKHQRLRTLAKSRGLSLNKLIEELSTIALAQHDAEIRFAPWRLEAPQRKDSRCWISWIDPSLVHGGRAIRCAPIFRCSSAKHNPRIYRRWSESIKRPRALIVAPVRAFVNSETQQTS